MNGIAIHKFSQNFFNFVFINMVKCSNCSYDINPKGEIELVCENCSRVDLGDLSGCENWGTDG